MGKIIISLCVGALAGFSVSHLISAEPRDTMAARDAANTLGSVECVCDMLRNEEIDPNRHLLEEIDRLQTEVKHLRELKPVPGASVNGDWLQAARTDLLSEAEPIDRKQQLIDGGFGAARAQWLVQRERDLQMEVLDGKPMGQLDSRLAARQALRKEVGDFEYEQYLAATGQSTAVRVTQVLADSPAQVSGLQVGDEIVDYDGVRVFNMFDLSDLTRSGTPGEAIIVNIERDGSPMQLVMSRGAMGISGGKPVSR